VSNGFNEVSLKDDFKSVGSMMVEALQALAAMLVGGLQKAWEAVQNAVNAIVEWIKSIVINLITEFLHKITNFISTQITLMLETIQHVFMPLINALSHKGNNEIEEIAVTSAETFLTNKIIESVWIAIFTMAAIVQVIEFIVMVFTNAVPGLSLILSAVVSGVICGLLYGGITILIREILQPSDLFKENTAFWAGGVGLAVESIFIMMSKTYTVGVDIEIKGMTLAFFALLIQSISIFLSGIWLWFTNWLSFILAVIGLTCTLTPSVTDNPANPLWWLEELFSALAVSFTAGILIFDSDGDGIPNGLDLSP